MNVSDKIGISVAIAAVCNTTCLLGGVPLRGTGGGGGRGASSRGAPAPPGGLATANTNRIFEYMGKVEHGHILNVIGNLCIYIRHKPTLARPRITQDLCEN